MINFSNRFRSYRSNNAQECKLCGELSFGTCIDCWTMCQTCGRGVNTDDCSKINVEGFEDADFCIQCSSNLFSFNNEVNFESIIKFAQTVRPLIPFLGATNVLYLTGTVACVVCDHRIHYKRSCCDECSYSYLVKQLNRIFHKSHTNEIISFMEKYDE